MARNNATPVSGMRVCFYLGKRSSALQYVNHIITGYTAESGSHCGTSEPRLTLHLKSPAAQQAEAAARAAEEEKTGWVSHECQRVRLLNSAFGVDDQDKNVTAPRHNNIHFRVVTTPVNSCVQKICHRSNCLLNLIAGKEQTKVADSNLFGNLLIPEFLEPGISVCESQWHDRAAHSHQGQCTSCG